MIVRYMNVHLLLLLMTSYSAY